jgi:hypothetical protein
MVAPMLMHAYTDATAAGQALIAAQFATVFQVVKRAIWQFLDAILLAAWWIGIGRLICQDHLRLSRLSPVLATAAAAGAAANVAGLSVVRDVLVGVLFALWTAWWISLLVYLRANHKQLPQLPRRDRGAASCGLVDGQPVMWRPAVCGIGGGLIMRPRRRSTAGSVSSPLRAARARHCPDPRALVAMLIALSVGLVLKFLRRPLPH